jgi:hypothetical protein
MEGCGMNFKELWNSQADHQNEWDSLGEDEKLEFAMAHEREECAKIADKNADRCNKNSMAYMLLSSNADAIRARGKA